MVTTETLRDTQVIIDLSKIANNLKLIKEMVGDNVALMPVIKANGYGHGAVAIAPTLIESGATYLAVATLSEALELRKAYSEYPIFILGHTPDKLLHHIVDQNITQTVFSLAQAQIINDHAKKQGKVAKIHIKVDTGFHRLGCTPSEEFANEIRQINMLFNIDLEGIFSHLALVNDEENQKQYSTFTAFIHRLEELGVTFTYSHIADSIATVDFPEYRMNMVRPGALIYGMRGYHKGYLPVEPALTFRTAISQLHQVPEGEGVGYDYLWKAPKDSLVATMPFGYADGYPRNLRDKGYVMIGGAKAPIIGVICMDQCVADVSDVPNVAEGMECIIYGNGLDGSMTIDEASKKAETNKNDIIARISARPPRVYLK